VKYVLDTNIVSALMRGDPIVVDRLRRAGKASVVVPQPVLSEVAYGIARLPRSRRRDRLQRRFDAIRKELVRASWTDLVSEHFGVIKATAERRGEAIEDFDAAVAAHATATGASLVTTDVQDMARVHGLTLEDWTQPILQ
jgi:tRNA(fMet)-specific endonuclease VapC